MIGLEKAMAILNETSATELDSICNVSYLRRNYRSNVAIVSLFASVFYKDLSLEAGAAIGPATVLLPEERHVLGFAATGAPVKLEHVEGTHVSGSV